MTRTEIERLAAVEERLDSVDRRTERIESKLDAAIECKADKTELATLSEAVDKKASADDFKEMRRLLVGILISIAGTAILVILKTLGVW